MVVRPFVTMNVQNFQNTATIDENIEEIHILVLNYRRMKICELSDIANISTDRVLSVIPEHLQTKIFHRDGWRV